MSERIAFITGHLAEPRLRRVLTQMGETPFTWEIRNAGVKVAALMTVPILLRRLGALEGVDRAVLPGRFRGDLEELARHFKVPFERGPDEVKDLPQHFGRAGGRPDLSRHDCRIFAEIVEAPALTVEAILARAAFLRGEGADVIDLGGLPGTPFPHLEEAVQALVAAGHEVSVDSGDLEELRRGARAGASFLLSLTEESLHLAEESAAVPVLVPVRHGDMASLLRACAAMERRGRPYLADPVLDPIHMGFTASVVRYHEFRRAMPGAEMLMGVGNLTELTDADTTGITMTLMGMVSELAIRNVLVVQVSPHCRRAVRETDRARRILFAAREEGALPQGFDASLLCLRDRRPFPNSSQEIAENAAQVADRNFRIEVSEDGIHVYNRDIHRTGADPFQLYPHLGVEADGAHAFYLGVELARAQVAHELGKRYAQDSMLEWGCAVDRVSEDGTRFAAAGTTLQDRKRGQES
ncbi:DUF6513 domain-containing protein [Marinimicrococcus flavescens]|uniref:DUF6513 domain-containing protein n=1 Tax=Marinimicrococcus flavescens TaxID=3031815 RepID=A0AAP3V098_9PROT|nr:DUF6513 domain-containing protein [Marinimicrococcus flavescens]